MKLRVGPAFDEQIKTSRNFKIYVAWMFLFTIGGCITVIYKFINGFNDQNLFSTLWIKCEIIAIIVEIPYWSLLTYQKTQASKSTGLIETIVHSTTKDFQKITDGDQAPTEEKEYGDQNVNERKAELEIELKQGKNKLELEEDFVTMTVLCYLKKNQDEFLIHETKQSQMFFSCMVAHFIVDSMLFAMLYAIITNEGGEYTPNTPKNFGVWFVKFPCTIALHFVLYPEVANGMMIMKFSNNQHHLFVNNGDKIAYILGLS